MSTKRLKQISRINAKQLLLDHLRSTNSKDYKRQLEVYNQLLSGYFSRLTD